MKGMTIREYLESLTPAELQEAERLLQEPEFMEKRGYQVAAGKPIGGWNDHHSPDELYKENYVPEYTGITRF